MARRVVGDKKKAGIKVLVYGGTGTGKSCFGLTAPNSYAIDTESGLLWYEGEDITIGGKVYNNLKMINTTQNLDELEEDLDDLLEGNLEGIETLIIDSMTRFHDAITLACLADEEAKAKKIGKNPDTRSAYGQVKRITTKLQLSVITASAKGINVIEVCQEKEKEDEKTKVKSIVPACHSMCPYDADTILYFFTKDNPKTKEVEYYTRTIKDRSGATKKGDINQNATFDIWAEHINGRGKNLQTIDADFTKDFENTQKAVESDVEKIEELTNTIKDLIKKTSDKSAIKTKFAQLGIDVKNMASSDSKKLIEAKEYIEELISNQE